MKFSLWNRPLAQKCHQILLSCVWNKRLIIIMYIRGSVLYQSFRNKTQILIYALTTWVYNYQKDNIHESRFYINLFGSKIQSVIYTLTTRIYNYQKDNVYTRVSFISLCLYFKSGNENTFLAGALYFSAPDPTLAILL